jgi:stearoyl-CoA desaturase (delta-9 desaturase)
MLRESYHNNHHKYPSSLNFGVHWHEVDAINLVIRFLGWLHVVKLPKVIPVNAIDEPDALESK